MKPLLVGESNPYSDDPRFALYPYPSNSAGARLARILGMARSEYLRVFDRVNLSGLIPGRGSSWSVRNARVAASKLGHPVRVLLGARVAAAHGIAFRPFSAGVSHGVVCLRMKADAAKFGGQSASCLEGGGCISYLVLPHPSGRSRLWSVPLADLRARAAVRRFLAYNRGEGICQPAASPN